MRLIKNYPFAILAVLVALGFWFFDSAIHYFVYQEDSFTTIPEDFNELWMRMLIVSLMICLGLFSDIYSAKIIAKEKQLEAIKIYDSMVYASHHILNNLLNQMLLFKLEAEKCESFDPKVLDYYDKSIEEATFLLSKLSALESISDQSIWTSVSPRNQTTSHNDK